MTVAARYRVLCDNPACDAACEGSFEDRTQALEAAYAGGWSRGSRSGRHFCPLHDPRSLFAALRDAGFEVVTDDPVVAP